MSTQKIIGVIPARYASTRFPGKPLVEINGKTMIERVYTQTKLCSHLSDVYVATDDARIFDTVNGFGGIAIMTKDSHPTGTDRIIEVLELLNTKPDVIINIQGDEPYIRPEQISKVAECFDNKDCEIATLIKKINDIEELENPNVVKAVIANNKKAIYFSRHAIPYYRGAEGSEKVNLHDYFKHIGIYGYKSSTLLKIKDFSPSKLEKAESLEQLRWIENGINIYTQTTDFETFAIDTPEDLERLKKLIV